MTLFILLIELAKGSRGPWRTCRRNLFSEDAKKSKVTHYRLL